MASNVPVVRQVAWISIIPQLILMGLIVLACYRSGASNPFMYGALIYLAISYGLKTSLAKDHNRGVQLTKQHSYVEAIPFFEASYKYFTAHPWMDKYRYITLLSSSKMCYREMALCNIAFSYSQVGDGKKAAEYYRKTLESFPDNGMAQAGLRMLDAAGKPADGPL
jgi:tetratricopeptide (TPR) repeat protein